MAAGLRNYAADSKMGVGDSNQIGNDCGHSFEGKQGEIVHLRAGLHSEYEKSSYVKITMV